MLENALLFAIPIALLLAIGLAWLITEHGPIQLGIQSLTTLRAVIILLSMLVPELIRKARYWQPYAGKKKKRKKRGNRRR